ncbi:MAG: FtsX-like permease family protein [Bacteroidota bacterium]
MNATLFIARRYFFSKRKKSFINAISQLSVGVVAFFSGALIVVLSVFNGLGELLRSVHVAFDPELKIEATRKTFEVTDKMRSDIKSTEGVALFSEVIEDYAYARYGDLDLPVIIRGISDNLVEQGRLDDHMVVGELALHKDSIPFAIVGIGVKNQLHIDVHDDMHVLQLFYIRNASGGGLDPSRLYARKSIRPGGAFSIEKKFDENYVFVPLDFAAELLNYGNRRTWIEIKTTPGADIDRVKKALGKKLGDDFKVLTNDEQHADLYKLLKLEKLFVGGALAVLTLIGSINIFFSLMMLAIDKKKDISVLFAIGAYPQFIRTIFISEGAIISIVGTAIGLSAGALLCYLQATFGLVGMGMDDAIQADYPVKMIASDFLLAGGLAVIMTFVTSFYPASLAAKSYSVQNL